jgi:hypothetical protein
MIMNPSASQASSRTGYPLKVTALAALVIILVSVLSTLHPIPNERGLPASPLHLAPSSDIQFYMNGSEDYFSDHGEDIWSKLPSIFPFFSSESDNIVPELTANQVALPVFPLLIKIFDYRQGNTLPLAFIFILVGIGMSAIWINIFWKNGVPFYALIAFAFLPHVVWFTINLGTDLLLAFLFALFFKYYMPMGGGSRNIKVGLVIAILAVLTRPTGVSLVAFLAIDQLLLSGSSNRQRATWIGAGFAILSIPLIMVIFPYFLSVLEGSNSWPFFGILQAHYLTGLHHEFPIWLDLTISWASLIGAKLFYTFGFRPSYGETELLLVILRTLPGIPFFVGFTYLLFKGRFTDKLLLLSVLIPILSGPAQDRYLLPVQPLLFFYCWLAMVALFPGLRRKTEEGVL